MIAKWICFLLLAPVAVVAQTVKDGVRTDSLVDNSSDGSSASSLIGVPAPRPSPPSMEETQELLLQEGSESKIIALNMLIQRAYAYPENIPDLVRIWSVVDSTYASRPLGNSDACYAVLNLYSGRFATTSEMAVDLSATVQNLLPKIGYNPDSMVCYTIGGEPASLGAAILEWVRLMNFKPLEENQVRRAGLQSFVDELRVATGVEDTTTYKGPPQKAFFDSDPLAVPRAASCGWQDRDDDKELTKSRQGNSVQKGLYECGVCPPEVRSLSAKAFKEQTTKAIDGYLKEVQRPVLSALLFQNILRKSSCRQYFLMWDEKGLSLIKQSKTKSPILKWLLEATKEMELKRDR